VLRTKSQRLSARSAAKPLRWNRPKYESAIWQYGAFCRTFLPTQIFFRVMKNRGRRILLFAMHLCVIAMLVGCVCLSVVPRSTIAAAFGVNECCLGKSAGHCSISLRKKRPLPKPEPMCGAKSPDTAAATASENEDQSDSKSIKRPDSCKDCPSCTLGSKQRSRDKSIVTSQQAIKAITNSHAAPKVEPSTIERLSPVRQITPRGPPHT
jgi:hypothetical protein